MTEQRKNELKRYIDAMMPGEFLDCVDMDDTWMQASGQLVSMIQYELDALPNAAPTARYQFVVERWATWTYQTIKETYPNDRRKN